MKTTPNARWCHGDGNTWMLKEGTATLGMVNQRKTFTQEDGATFDWTWQAGDAAGFCATRYAAQRAVRRALREGE